MKCPKCDYLGFETGDRCRNCGYDFTLMSPGGEAPDLDLLRADDVPSAVDIWLKEPEPSMVGQAADATLPLFTPSTDDDEPLIRMPAAPRPPLAVRRAPETPRLRGVAKVVRRPTDPTFEFVDDPATAYTPVATVTPPPLSSARAAVSVPVASGAVARLTAALIDNSILLAIDVTVVYFTLKIAALSLADWRLLPVAPLLAFLLLLKFAYFSVFTAVGGQTIGKMGAGIRVVADDGALIDASRAVRRSLAGSVSIATLGAAFAPALLGSDGRALHDRVAHTRVVSL